MLKKIKVENIQGIPSFHIPYQNYAGNWVWRHPSIPEDARWPGRKSPAWVKKPIFVDGAWYWSD